MPSTGKKTRTATEYTRLDLLETSAVGIQAYPDAHYNKQISNSNYKEETPMSNEADLAKEAEKKHSELVSAMNTVVETVKSLKSEVETLKTQKSADFEQKLVEEITKKLNESKPKDEGLAKKTNDTVEAEVLKFKAEIDTISKDRDLSPLDKVNKKTELVGSQVGLFLRELVMATRGE